MKVIALGDNCIDLYHNTGERFPGGNAINVAVHVAHQGVESEYLGNFADDEMANLIKESLEKNGVDFSNCPCLRDTTTKICSYDVVGGERSFVEVIEGDRWAGPIQLNSELLRHISAADAVVSSCNAKIPEQIVRVAELPVIFAYDFGEKEKYRTQAYFDQVCHEMDLALFSMEKLTEEAFCEFCAPLHKRGVKHILATMGSAGPMISNGRQICKMDIQKVNACDTMGAGDSFLAGFVCELLRQGWKKSQIMQMDKLEKALSTGRRVSALNCMHRGGFGNG